MFTLYYKPDCAFSERVMQMAGNFNVALDLKDISESDEAMGALQALSGTTKTPFLVDIETGVSLGESSDIIDYLRTHANLGTPSAVVTRPRVHVGGSVCESCEG